MQKVVTVTTHTNVLDKNQTYVEREYEKINQYLQEGYVVIQLVPFTTSAEGSFRYTLTFVLEKKSATSPKSNDHV